VAEYPHDVSTANWAMVELIEAAVRAGTPELAAGARSRLAEMARVSGTDWALGIAARSEALLVEDLQAEELYVEAVDRLGRSRMAVDLARAHLLFGEWLRRQRRRLDARRNCGRHTTFSPTSAWRRSPSAHASNWKRPASMLADAPSTPLLN
jgi:hypothetical protein